MIRNENAFPLIMQELLGNENATRLLLLLLRNALQGHRRAHNENAIWLKRNENVLQGQRPYDHALAGFTSSTISISYHIDRIVIRDTPRVNNSMVAITRGPKIQGEIIKQPTALGFGRRIIQRTHIRPVLK